MIGLCRENLSGFNAQAWVCVLRHVEDQNVNLGGNLCLNYFLNYL